MGFLEGLGKEYANETREEQFLRYFRDMGAAEALEKAMILLYKMPIKPPDLAEFFAEYFENGARELVTLSLLKAEICFKHTEREDLQKRVQTLVTEISKLEEQGFGKNEEDENFEDNVEDKVEDELPGPDPSEGGMLDRFLVDLDNNVQIGASVPSSALYTITEEYEDSWGDAERAAEREAHRQAQLEWHNEIRKLDPWGLVCTSKIPSDLRLSIGKIGDEERKSLLKSPSKHSGTSATDLPHPTELMSIIADEFSEDNKDKEAEDKEYVSDDAETIAEMYHSYAHEHGALLRQKKKKAMDEESAGSRSVSVRSAAGSEPDEPNDKVIVDKKKLLSVVKPQGKSKSKLGERMGWENVPTEEDELNLKESESQTFQSFSQRSMYPRPNWAQFTEAYGAPSPTSDAPCLKDIDFYKDISWQDDAAKLFPIHARDESFLLDYDMARIAKKLQTTDEPGFMFEYYQKFPKEGTSEEKQHVCGKCGKWKSVEKVNKATSTTGIDDCRCDVCKCTCAEDDEFPANCGTMTNWTQKYGEFAGEEGKIKTRMKTSLEKLMEIDSNFGSSIKTTCECDKMPSNSKSPPPSPIFSEQCASFCKKGDGGRDSDSDFDTGRRRTSIDPELEKAFKEGGGYASDSEGPDGDSKRKRSSQPSTKPGTGNTDGDKVAGVARPGEEPNYVSDVYSVNLGHEIKKQFGIPPGPPPPSANRKSTPPAAAGARKDTKNKRNDKDSTAGQYTS